MTPPRPMFLAYSAFRVTEAGSSYPIHWSLLYAYAPIAPVESTALVQPRDLTD